jgi:hypothetical protein
LLGHGASDFKQAVYISCLLLAGTLGLVVAQGQTPAQGKHSATAVGK